MKTPPATPYLLPAAEAVSAEDWTDADGGAVGDRLEHWDPFTVIALARIIEVDLDLVRESCGLSPGSALALSTVAYSSRTRLRTVGESVELGTLTGRVRAPVSIEVPGSRAGGRLDLTTRLVLRTAGTSTTAISPQRPGAVLWTDETRLAVEGGAARFPVTPLDFASTQGLPDDAAWALEWDHDDLEAPVLGGLRLLINSGDETLVAALRTGSSDAAALVLQSFARYDIGRSLVHAALANERFTDAPESWPEGSIGRTLHELIVTCWPGVPIPTLVARLRSEPARLDAELQAHLGVLP